MIRTRLKSTISNVQGPVLLEARYTTVVTMAPTKQKPHSTASRIYLLVYNIIGAALWLRILFTTGSTLIFSRNVSAVYTSLEPWTRCAQTLAAIEILHAAAGITSPFKILNSLYLTSRYGQQALSAPLFLPLLRRPLRAPFRSGLSTMHSLMSLGPHWRIQLCFLPGRLRMRSGICILPLC
jgi:hypothetical protein